jgi:hypothetical protein
MCVGRLISVIDLLVVRTKLYRVSAYFFETCFNIVEFYLTPVVFCL